MAVGCMTHYSCLVAQEDVVVMQKIDAKLIMSCGAVVSPLGWSGSRKVGLDLAGIHEPVPHFNDGVALKFVSKIFEKGLKAEVPLSRANWFIMHTSELSLVGSEHAVLCCAAAKRCNKVCVALALATKPLYDCHASACKAMLCFACFQSQCN